MNTKHLVPKSIALKLREIGYDELCVCYYYITGSSYPIRSTGNLHNWNSYALRVSAPSILEVIQWFEIQHNLMGWIIPYFIDGIWHPKVRKRYSSEILTENTNHESAIEAYLECISVMIKTVKETKTVKE